MKRYEKILLIILAIFFLLQVFDFIGKSFLFILIVATLSISYFIGGFWMLNSTEKKRYFLPITAGMIFSVSIFLLPYTIMLNFTISNTGHFLYLLPISNILLFITLSIYLFLKRKTTIDLRNSKLIFKRSLVILIVTSFFSFTPISFKPYRNTVYILNNGNTSIQNNILLFDYTAKFDDALENGECEKAIEYAENANRAGKFWLAINYEKIYNSNDIEELIKKLQKDPTKELSPEILKDLEKSHYLDDISGTYSNLYRAYRCRAENEFGDSDYKNALYDYKKAYSNLIACNHHSKNLEKRKPTALTDIASCYEYLGQYNLADSFFTVAAKSYLKIVNKKDNGYAVILSYFGRSLSKDEYYKTSNKLILYANNILIKDRKDEETRSLLVENYKIISRNYLNQMYYQKALLNIKKAIGFAKKDESNYFESITYYGTCLYLLNEYKQADSVLKSCIRLAESQNLLREKEKAEIYYLLSKVNINLGEYDDARKYITSSIEFIKNNIGESNAKYAAYLTLLADINKIVGNYSEAEIQYNTIINIYTSLSGERNEKLPSILGELADLEIILAKTDLAKQLSDNSISIALDFTTLNNPKATDLLNKAGYINYCIGNYKVADTLYQKTIKINRNYELYVSPSTASAMNGLGLIEMGKDNYKKADSLFSASLDLHKKIFTEKNPFTAIIYLNYGILRTKENNLDEAEIKINKALTIDKQFFKNDHDIFGDIYSALGDIAKKRRQIDVAKDFYQKALDIYRKKFPEDHWKIKSALQKLK